MKKRNFESLLMALKDAIKNNNMPQIDILFRNIANYESYFIGKVFTNANFEVESIRDLGSNSIRVHVRYDYEYYTMDNGQKRITKGYKYSNISIQENAQELKIIETDMLNERSLSIKAFRRAVIVLSIIASGVIAYLLIS